MWGVLALVFALCMAPAFALADDDAASGESPATGNVLVDAGYELENGEYTVEIMMEGGSGRASIESPTILTVEGGSPYITITWSSDNYDYMKVDGTKYRPVTTKPTSRFVVPLLAIDEPFEMSADTTAMGTSHEIEYAFTVDGTTLEKVVTESDETDASSDEAASADSADAADAASASASGEAASSESASAASVSSESASAASASSASASAASSDASAASSAASESSASTVSKAEATDDTMMIIAVASLIIATIAIAVMVGVLRGYSQRN